MKSKRGMEAQAIGWWVVGIAALLLLLGGYMVIKMKGVGTIDFLKDFLRLRR